MDIISDFSSLEKRRRINIFDEKWRLAFHLYLALGKLSLSPLIFVRNCSHYFSAHERGRQIKITIFLEPFKEHGHDISSILLRRVFRTFDSFQQGYIDWRELAFILTCVSRDSTPVEDLCNAFAFYTGHNSIDIDCINPKGVRIRDIERVMSYILSPIKMQDIMLEFYDEWGKDVVFGKDSPNEYMNLTKFRKLATKITSDIDPFHFEDEYYPKLYSRLKNTKRLIKKRLTRITLDALRSNFHHWKHVIHREKKIRSQLLTVLDKYYDKVLRMSFVRLRRFAVQVVIIVAFQRLFIRHRTKLRARLERNRQKCATIMQSIVRMILGKQIMKKLIWKQSTAAIDIQRVVRGYLGRIIAWKRIQTKLDEIEIERRKELEQTKHHAYVQAVIRIQRYYKIRYAKQQLKKMIHKQRTVLLISREMEEYEKERAIVSKQAVERREARKTQLVRKQMEENKVRAQSQLLRDMQRKNKIQEEMRLKKMNEMKEKERIKNETRSTWEHKIEIEVASYRKYCQECLKDPKTKSDRKFKKQINVLTKKRINDVLKRADDRGIEIEIDAARKVSQIEVIEILVRAKRDEMENDMKNDLLRFDQEIA